VQTTQGIFLFTLKERQESRLPELSEVRVSVEQAYRVQQAGELANATADRLLSAAQEQKSLRKAAAELKLTIEETGEFSRGFGSFVPRIGSSEELAGEAFGLTEEEPIGSKVYNLSGKAIVFSLKENKPADFTSLDETGRAALRDQLLASKKEEAISDKLKELQEQAQLEIMVPELASAFN
jgi:peptidyl-prolyl cis-trans isomerase D